MRLLLVRHGESTWNAEGRIQGWGDPPLSEKGRRQAEALARRLSRLAAESAQPLAALYTSPQQRACETAAIIASALSLRPIPDDRLKECDVGDFTGLTNLEVQERYPEFHRQWRQGMDRLPIPGEEPIQVFLARIRAAMSEIVAAHEAQATLCIVSHGGTFGVYLDELIGLPMTKRSPFYFDNASLTIVALDKTRHRIMLLNDTCHLEEI